MAEVQDVLTKDPYGVVRWGCGPTSLCGDEGGSPGEKLWQAEGGENDAWGRIACSTPPDPDAADVDEDEDAMQLMRDVLMMDLERPRYMGTMGADTRRPKYEDTDPSRSAASTLAGGAAAVPAAVPATVLPVFMLVSQLVLFGRSQPQS